MVTVYRYWEHAIEIEWHADCDLAKEFLAAYFAPYFDIQDDGAHKAELVAHVNVHLSASMANLPDGLTVKPVPIDSSKGFLHCTGRIVPSTDGALVLLEPFGVLIGVEYLTRTINIWGPSAASLRIPLLRIIEDVILNEVQRHGAVVLHASAVVAGGRAMLLVGNKKAGKTTGLCRLLSGFDVAKLANDNVCVSWRNGRLTARGWPAFFKVSVATAAAVRELNRDLPSLRRSVLENDDALWEVYEKVALYPSQGAQRFSTVIEPEAEIGCLIFPAYRAEAGPAVLPISIDEVAAELPTFLQGVRNSNHSEWLGLNRVSEADVVHQLGGLVAHMRDAHTPIYRICWAQSLEELFGRIAELRPFHKGIRACLAAESVDNDWPALPETDLPLGG